MIFFFCLLHTQSHILSSLKVCVCVYVSTHIHYDVNHTERL